MTLHAGKGEISRHHLPTTNKLLSKDIVSVEASGWLPVFCKSPTTVGALLAIRIRSLQLFEEPYPGAMESPGRLDLSATRC